VIYRRRSGRSSPVIRWWAPSTRWGRGAGRFRLGERIGIAWLRHTCGTCADCRRGDENLCVFSRYTGWHEDGGYAELAVVPEAFAYRIPDVFTDVEAAPLLCAGIIGYRALRRSDVPPGGRLGLYGFGSSAHVTLQVARQRGCEVYVATRGEEHQRLARALGAAWTGAADEPPPVPAIASWASRCRARLASASGKVVVCARMGMRAASARRASPSCRVFASTDVSRFSWNRCGSYSIAGIVDR